MKFNACSFLKAFSICQADLHIPLKVESFIILYMSYFIWLDKVPNSKSAVQKIIIIKKLSPAKIIIFIILIKLIYKVHFIFPLLLSKDSSMPGSSVLHYLPVIFIELVMLLSNHSIFCLLPLLLLPSVFPSIRVFSSELALHLRWSKFWSSVSVLLLNIQGLFP